jgi:hypothetical protein
MKKMVKIFGIIALTAIIWLVLASCPEPDPESPADSVITIPIIQGVSAPVAGYSPVARITENAQYSGTVTWEVLSGSSSNSNPSAFAALTEYIAVITLTAKTGYTLQGVGANFFMVAGATSVRNNANSGVITAVFPRTAYKTPTASDFNISGLTQVFNYDARPVSITPKSGESQGQITIYYAGTGGTAYSKSTDAPWAVGAYTVTFDVSAAAGFNAVTGLNAGTLNITSQQSGSGNPDVFTSVTAFEDWLKNQPDNTAAAPYVVKLNINVFDLRFESNLSTTIRGNANKYVYLDLSGSTTNIGYHAFDRCPNLTGITIPNGVTSIGESAFYECTSLTSVTIPNSVTSIWNEAFNGCTNLRNITIKTDKLITSTNNWGTIFLATNLAVTFEDVTSIGQSAFYNCTRLTSVTISDSVTSIGGYAFSGCTGLTSVTIPNSVTSIVSYAFLGCTSLTSVTFETGSAIDSGNFGYNAFPQGNSNGDALKTAYLSGGAGTYTKSGDTWTKQ